MRYRPLAKQFFVLFTVGFIGLGFAGANNPDDLLFKFREDKLVVAYTDEAGDVAESQLFDDYSAAKSFSDGLPDGAAPSVEVSKSGFKWLWLAQILTAYYFAYFLIILPLLGIVEKPKARPLSIADSVFGHSGSASVGATAPAAAAARSDDV